MAGLEKVALDETARALEAFWSQRVVGEANGSLYKVAKGIRSTEWHAHDDQDEVFVVTSGELVVELRDDEIRLGPGELLVVPRGVEHRPRAEEAAHFLIVGRGITSNAAGGKPTWSERAGPPPAG